MVQLTSHVSRRRTAAGTLLRLGAEVEVLSSPELRGRLRVIGIELAARYAREM